MKKIILIVATILIAITVVIGSDYLYEVVNKESSVEATNSTKSSAKKQTADVSNKKTVLKKTHPHFSEGFDWSLPTNTKVTKNSGLLSENSYSINEISNRFSIVLWSESNPQQGQYDFTRFEKQLKRIAPKRVLVRLEVNSSCEAPKWALEKLRETKHKSLIFWDKNYQEVTRPFIETFAKRYAANPQIIGVQLGLADGEFGEAADSCSDYDNKQGWGEFWMSPSERQEAETDFGFNPEIFTQATIENIDIYANAFGEHKGKLAFTNIGTLFTYGQGADPYNKNLKKIAKYALDKGLGNRDGAVERWMSYTDKVYGSTFKTMPDGSCLLGMNEQYIRQFKSRYWGTENEFYGNKDYVIAEMGPVKNHPYIFLISSLRALQMRRNFMSISNMSEITHEDYKIQEFLKYLTLSMGKQYEDTPDAFLLMGERYIVPYRLVDQMDNDCVSNNKEAVKVRSFGRWLSESPSNTQVENKPVLKIRMPKDENYWYQGYYLPEGIDYEYFARQAKVFAFDLNDQLSQNRCQNECEVEVKATFKDTVKTKLHIEVAEGISESIETMGDGKIKTVSFKISSRFNNQLQSSYSSSDLSLLSESEAIPLILMRINFMESAVN